MENKCRDNVTMDFVNNIFKVMDIDVTELIVGHTYWILFKCRQYIRDKPCEELLEDKEFMTIFAKSIVYSLIDIKLRYKIIPNTINSIKSSIYNEYKLFYWKVKGNKRYLVFLITDIPTNDINDTTYYMPRDIYYVMYATYQYKKYRDELDPNRIKPCKQ